MRAKIQPRIETARPRLEELIPLSTPLVVFVDPSSACNFACSFCPTGHRDLVAGRFNGVMKYDLFCKIVDDLAEFDQPVRVLRLYKDGEPFLNKRLADMVRYAKASGRVGVIDTTTNGSLLDPDRVGPVLEAGINRINISVDGMDADGYRRTTGVEFNFEKFVDNVRWLYDHRGSCEVVVKTINEILTEDQRAEFMATFGDHCDRIFVENFSPCWPEFDGEGKTGWKITAGLYGQSIREVLTCPYIFYSYSVNADGLVSACFIDWGRKLVVGDVRRESMKAVWDSEVLRELRLQHLRGERKKNPVCGGCGQLSNCAPDDIDLHRERLLAVFEGTPR